MKTYTIPVVYTMSAKMKIKANNLEEALIKAENAPLPSDADYVEGSFEVDYSVIPYVNKLSKEEKQTCNVVSF